MKLLKTLNRLKVQFLTKLPSNDVYLKTLVSLLLLSIISAAIWYGSPLLSFNDIAPFQQPEKRIYIVAFLFLIWLLKLLLIDLDMPNPLHYQDTEISGRLLNLLTRFQGAIKFLKKTTITRQDELIQLSKLPWYLLLGPKDAGKTAFLAHAHVNYILQKQIPAGKEQLPSSENCDWWVTREACFVDVPGYYLAKQETQKDKKGKPGTEAVFWHFFLRLVKKYHHREGVQGIIITLPIPQIMMEYDAKYFHMLLRELFQRIYELHKVLPKRLACYVVVTKCDLLPGFTEFFAEAANEELAQAWGISLPDIGHTKPIDMLAERFNALIKKLNQQLLFRLHQERNPLSRPHIKDFPLQVERVKGYILEFVKRLSQANFNMSVQGVYLTSGQQFEKQQNAVIEEVNNVNRSLVLFKEPTRQSRSFFIKQLVMHGFHPLQPIHERLFPAETWKRRFSYAVALSIIASTAVLLGKDFERGVNQAYAIQNYLSDYRLATQKNHNPIDHLLLATALLDTLQQMSKKTVFKFDLSYVLSFYSHKSQQKANSVYKEALKEILLPEVKNLMEDYLKNPVNKNTEQVYAVLKAYLMLDNQMHFQSSYVLHTFEQILPSSLPKNKADGLMYHVTLALTQNYQPQELSSVLIAQTRKYLNAMPNFQLGYIILKNINSNNIGDEINLGTSQSVIPVFVALEERNEIPSMFTYKSFPKIFSQEIVQAADEAIHGNWILGERNSKTSDLTQLTEQLRLAYTNNYIDAWETLLANVQLSAPKDLHHLDAMLQKLISNESPLLQMLRTLHENTYFEPVLSSSQKLQGLSTLLSKDNASVDQLYRIFSGLQGLHQYIQAIMHAENQKKAAFEAMSYHMLNRGTPDALAKLRQVAEKAPEPLKGWLNKIANQTWHFLMQDAGHYIDTSWQTKIINFYQSNLANRYPFSTHAKEDVALEKFSQFFGNPGLLIAFYNDYLQAFIDTSKQEWHWKNHPDYKLPFAEDTLRQIQQALLINRVFFPNGDDKLFVQFALQPYQFGKHIKSVKLSINDKLIVDDKTSNNPHVVSWPNSTREKKSVVELTLADKKTLSRDYPGEWGWFKLVNESFDSLMTKKQMLLNVSLNDQPAKYLLFTEGPNNPFLTIDLRRFNLPGSLINEPDEANMKNTTA